jgi:hypothetical protein
MSRGPGKLQRDILAAVAERGTAITTADIADLVVGPFEYDDHPFLQQLTSASETKVRNCRRAVSALIRTGHLVDVSFGDRHRWVELPVSAPRPARPRRT